MNFQNISISEALASELSAMEHSRRVPHAIIISGGDEQSREEFCKFLSQWTVCTADEKPCGVCAQCTKVKSQNHIDVYYAKGSGKTDVISVEEMREIIRNSAIIPNEAPKKVYIMIDADKRMGVGALNAFLKTLEEPVQDTLFILTAESPKSLPQTIRSRCVNLNLEKTESVSEADVKLCDEILEGILDTKEIGLLRSLSVLSSRAVCLKLLNLLRRRLCEVLTLSVGAEPEQVSDAMKLLSHRLTKDKIIKLIDATSDAINKTNRNVNLTLLSTWLCTEYRRIVWQK